MSIKTTTSIIAGLTLVFSSLNYADASCVESTLQENYDRADFVVRGTAISAEDNFIKGEYIEFSVDTYFKGEGSSHIKVTGNQSKDAETSVDFSIEEGARYLLFLKGDNNKILKTDLCSGSRKIDGALSYRDRSVLGNGEAPTQEKSSISLISGTTLMIITVVVLIGVGGVVVASRKELHKEHHDHIE